jgi:hypothetical protein
MPYYKNEGWGEMHWACLECLVRPMCKERCDKTYLAHWSCEGCDGRGCLNSGFPCKTTERYIMFERVQERFGEQIVELVRKNLEETSVIHQLIKLMKKREKSCFLHKSQWKKFQEINKRPL